MRTLDHVIQIARLFVPASDAAHVTADPYGSGNINDTYLVSVGQPTSEQFILQRINQHVFRRPEWIMANLRTVNEHILAKMRTWRGRPWEIMEIVPTASGEDYLFDEDGEFWRALTYIEGAHTHLAVRDARHAGEAGFALGTFQRLISDLDPRRLYDTLPGFHVMPHYLAHYDEVVQGLGEPLSGKFATPEVRYGMDCVARYRTWATRLDEACRAGVLRERPIHGDPKIDNIMIDDETGQAVSIIDLDTVKPGLVQFDIGDCLRSSCNPLGEETDRFDEVHFDLDLCRVILEGYLPEVAAFYTPADYAYVYDGLRTLAFEMALRFFTDYLEGDVYFKTRYPEHNLNRAMVQFRLLESIEAQEREIRQLIDSMTPV